MNIESNSFNKRKMNYKKIINIIRINNNKYLIQYNQLINNTRKCRTNSKLWCTILNKSLVHSNQILINTPKTLIHNHQLIINSNQLLFLRIQLLCHSFKWLIHSNKELFHSKKWRIKYNKQVIYSNNKICQLMLFMEKLIFKI